MNIENGWKAIDRFLKILSGGGLVVAPAGGEKGQTDPAGTGDAGGMFEGYKAPEKKGAVLISKLTGPVVLPTFATMLSAKPAPDVPPAAS